MFLPSLVLLVINDKIKATPIAINAGTGISIPKNGIFPATVFVNDALNPNIGFAFDIVRATPLNIDCVPRVIING